MVDIGPIKVTPSPCQGIEPYFSMGQEGILITTLTRNCSVAHVQLVLLGEWGGQWVRVSLWSPDHPGTHSVQQDGLNLRDRLPLLGLEVRTTIARLFCGFNMYISIFYCLGNLYFNSVKNLINTSNLTGSFMRNLHGNYPIKKRLNSVLLAKQLNTRPN